jgi:hypothetical protein
MCFQVIEFATLLIKPFALAPSLCYVINSASDLHLYIRTNHGIKGKCSNIFRGIDSDLSMYLLVLHLGQIIVGFKLC